MSTHSLLIRIFPFLRWGRRLTPETIQADVMAGLTGAAIAFPQGVAFATIAGLPPEYGLYTSMVPAIIAALFGSSWHLVSGPTTAASIVMFSSLSTLALPGSPEYVSLAITLAFMVGILQLVMGLARLGTLVNFISNSVIIGFSAGAACLIAAKQAKTFLGLDAVEHGHWVDTVSYLWSYWDNFHPMVMLVGTITLLTGVVVQKRFRSTYMIIALFVGSASAVIFNVFLGESTTHIQMVEALPKQLPPLSMPEFSLDSFRDLASLAIATALFALTASVSTARSISIRSGQPIEGNQEFIGQGLSNIIGSFFSSYVSTGSFNRSGANFEAGARSPLAAILAGALLILIVLVVADMATYLPEAAIAGLLIHVAWRLINFKQIRQIIAADRKEAGVLIVTFLSTLLLDLEFAILLGVVLSLMFYLRKTSKPKLEPRAPDQDNRKRKFRSGSSFPECPQMKILQLDDSLYFGSVSHVGELLRLYREHYPAQKHLFLLTQGVNQIDVAGAELLVNESKARKAIGGDMYIYQLKDSAMKIINRGGYIDDLNPANIFDSKEEAITAIFSRLDRNICATCESRIFLECGSTAPEDRRRKPEEAPLEANLP
jgi:SulP family sulfate permease